MSIAKRPEPTYCPLEDLIGHQPDGRDYEYMHDSIVVKNAANDAVRELDSDLQDVVYDIVDGLTLRGTRSLWAEDPIARIRKTTAQIRKVLRGSRQDIHELAAWLRDNDLP